MPGPNMMMGMGSISDLGEMLNMASREESDRYKRIIYDIDRMREACLRPKNINDLVPGELIQVNPKAEGCELSRSYYEKPAVFVRYLTNEEATLFSKDAKGNRVLSKDIVICVGLEKLDGEAVMFAVSSADYHRVNAENEISKDE